MPAVPAADPLIPVPCRLPKSMAARFRTEADERGTSVSDVLRSYIKLEEAKPLGTVRPRKRVKSLAPVTAADPALLQALRLIGTNVNQIAHGLHAVRLLPGKRAVDATLLLAELSAMRGQLDRLAVQADPVPVPTA